MDSKKTPTIVLAGKTYHALPPKVKAWHDFVSFEAGSEDIPAEDYLDRMADLVASVFPSEVTGEKIIEDLDIRDLKPLYRELLSWIVELVNAKLSKIPNGETEPVK